jgi:hypothetical protein
MKFTCEVRLKNAVDNHLLFRGANKATTIFSVIISGEENQMSPYLYVLVVFFLSSLKKIVEQMHQAM